MNKSNFVWNPDATQVYSSNYGTQEITMESFNKTLGYNFVLDAGTETLTLKPTSLTNAFIWGNGEENPSEETLIYIRSGKLIIKADNNVEGGVDAQAPYKTNLFKLNIDSDASLEMYNIFLNGQGVNKYLFGYMDIYGDLIMKNMNMVATSKMNIQNEGRFHFEGLYLEIGSGHGSLNINSNPRNEDHESCSLNVRELNIDGYNLIEGKSRAKFTVQEFLSMAGTVTVVDDAQLTILCETRSSIHGEFSGIIGGGTFELGRGTSNKIIIDSGNGEFFPIPFQPDDSETGKYKGFFNFLSSKDDYSDNRGEFILKNLKGPQASLFSKAGYVTINGEEAVIHTDYTLRRENQSTEYILKLNQKKSH